MLFLIMSCSTNKTQKINNELVSVSYSIDLAKQSYISGCVQSLKDKGLKLIHSYCVQKSNSYIDDITDIIYSEPLKLINP